MNMDLVQNSFFPTFILMMFIATMLVGLAQKLKIPYPIALVLGGLTLGFLPAGNREPFDPNLILGVVLPPILYYAAYSISFREFRKNWKQIISLALGLVIFTTFVVGLLFKMLFPDLPWALAFAFGAIVSPPDAIAATTILKRFSISNRLLTVLEGESMVNDASAIVLFKLAVLALISGDFSLAQAGIDFVAIVAGGIGIGLITGIFIQEFSKRYLDPVVGVVFSFTIPYLTYFLADYFGFSGVLAVVTNGLVGAQVLLRHTSSLRRILGYAAWDIFIILMNCFVFILLGIQLRAIVDVFSFEQMLLYTFYAALISFTMFLVRMMWVYARSSIDYVRALQSKNSDLLCPQILREAAIVGWSGMRGIVSLAAALSLPYALPNGTELQGRNEVIFITFGVILMTLIIPGFTLTPLIEWLKVGPSNDGIDPKRVRNELAKTSEETIQKLLKDKKINEEEYAFLKDHFNMQLRLLEVTSHKHHKGSALEEARSLVLREQRKKLLQIWERLEIDDKLLNQIEHELDLQETHLARAELK